MWVLNPYSQLNFYSQLSFSISLSTWSLNPQFSHRKTGSFWVLCFAFSIIFFTFSTSSMLQFVKFRDSIAFKILSRSSQDIPISDGLTSPETCWRLLPQCFFLNISLGIPRNSIFALLLWIFQRKYVSAAVPVCEISHQQLTFVRSSCDQIFQFICYLQ